MMKWAISLYYILLIYFIYIHINLKKEIKLFSILINKRINNIKSII